MIICFPGLLDGGSERSHHRLSVRREKETGSLFSHPLVFSPVFWSCSGFTSLPPGQEGGRVRLTRESAQRGSQWWTCQTSVQSTDRDESKCPLASRECVTHTHEQTHARTHTHRSLLNPYAKVATLPGENSAPPLKCQHL